MKNLLVFLAIFLLIQGAVVDASGTTAAPEAATAPQTTGFAGTTEVYRRRKRSYGKFLRKKFLKK
ncbi:hypothetical protein KUTeg_011620 [Tegillarca granosa]|uniref:Uncharacterized protein n=1 Tax=Tegillarca granosa TaxID=220873 RepID=A0ABQ9EX57_TEGGR|nr:hypothetical protein KUTeg_011620 [Tegillarca granosa]